MDFLKDVFTFIGVSLGVQIVGICIVLGVCFVGCMALEQGCNSVNESMGNPSRIH